MEPLVVASMVIEIAHVAVDPAIRAMCARPYPNHPRGCPNFNHKSGCPPSTPSWFEKFALCKFFAIINAFDLAAHVERMRSVHPDWSQRQLECCLYWQSGARKQLARGIRAFESVHPDYTVDTCPEAGGVNVTETLRIVGVELEWPPTKIVRQVAIAGILR